MPTVLAFGFVAHSLPNLHKESSRVLCSRIGFQADSGRWEEGTEQGWVPSDGPAVVLLGPYPGHSQTKGRNPASSGAAVLPAWLICFADTKSIACTIYPQRLDVRRHSAAGPAAFRANGTARSPAAIFNYSQALGLTPHLTFRQSLQNCSTGPSTHSEG